MAPLPVALAMLSWKAPATVENSLASYQKGGILPLFEQRLLYFNEISDADRAVAAQYGFAAGGGARNVGIFGGLEALVAAASSEYVLFVENDLVLLIDEASTRACLEGVIADSRAENVPYFYMRNRRRPGDPFWRRARYESKFRVLEPLAADPPAAPGPVLRGRTAFNLRAAFEDWRRPALRGSAIFAEEHPDRRHPDIIRRSRHGHLLTDSRWSSWSNCGFLARRDLLADVILPRVRSAPSSTTLNGHQDVEASLKQGDWWRKQRIGVGQAEPGPFTHIRLDR